MKIKNILIVLFILAFLLGERFSFAQGVKFPFYVYEDYDSTLNHGAPSGWMGDYRDIIIDETYHKNPYSGKTCIKIVYTAEASRFAYWAGILWQFPANNSGDIDGGIDFTGAEKLTFWARGEEGNEIIDAFKMGGNLGAYPDTDTIGIYDVMLNKEWTKYEIDLTGCDVSYISGLFMWVASKHRNPDGIIFYLDEIRIE